MWTNAAYVCTCAMGCCGWAINNYVGVHVAAEVRRQRHKVRQTSSGTAERMSVDGLPTDDH